MLVLGGLWGALLGWGAAHPRAMAFLQPETPASTPCSPGFARLFSLPKASNTGSNTSWHVEREGLPGAVRKKRAGLPPARDGVRGHSSVGSEDEFPTSLPSA